MSAPNAATASENKPASHFWHDVLDAEPSIVDPCRPVLHEMHAASFVLPICADHFPLGQPLQGTEVSDDDEPAKPISSLNRPASHFWQPVSSEMAASLTPKVPRLQASQRAKGLDVSP